VNPRRMVNSPCPRPVRVAGGRPQPPLGAVSDLQDGQARRTVTSMVDDYESKVEYDPREGVVLE
jgi:hypothetical protein